MNKSKLAVVFLFAGIFIFVVFAYLIIMEKKSENITQNEKTDEALVCEINSQQIFPSEEQVHWADSKYFVSFNKVLKKISLNSWGLEQKKFISTEIGSSFLTCEKPNYHCLPLESKIEMVYFHPPYGLLKIQLINQVKWIPFSWDSKKLIQFGSPIAGCGNQEIDFKKTKIMQINDQWLIHEIKENKIYMFSLVQMQGASLRSAALGPQRIYRIEDNGQLHSFSCNNQLENSINKALLEPFQIAQVSDHFLIYKNDQKGLIYKFKNDFVFEKATQNSIQISINDDEQENFVFATADNLFKINFSDLNFREDPISPKTKWLKSSLYFNDDLKYGNFQNLFSNSKIILWSWPTFIGREQLDYIDLAKETSYKIKNNFDFSFSDPLFKKIGFYSPEIFYTYLSTDKKSLFKAYHCSSQDH